MRVFLAACVLSLVALPSRAQTLWSRPYEPNQIAVEALVPDAASNASALTGATFVTGTVSLSDNVQLAAELPVARYRPSVDGARGTTAVGNPFVGVGLSSTTIPLLFQIGVRFPGAEANQAAAIGRATDVGRTAAFEPEAFAVSGLVNGRLEVGRYSTLRLRTGLEFGSRPAPTGPGRVGNWRLHYDAQLWREGERLITGFSVTGRTRLSRPGASEYHALLSVMGNWKLVQPGLLAGTSLTDLFQRGTWTPIVGITLSVSYGRL
ncbi:MAG: hypothetical protein ABEL97_08785 [Salinibacter sp.]